MRYLLYAFAALLLVSCGGDGGEGDAAEIAEANGLPTSSSTVNCGGSVTASVGNDGTVNARGGDCVLGEAEEEDDDFPGEEFPPGSELPPFLGS